MTTATDQLRCLFTVCLLISLFFSSPLQAGPGHNQKGFFISIDGLNPNHVETLVEANVLRGGFAELYRSAAQSKQAVPVITTLTAASHVSTITCSTPQDHGVYSNSFLHEGERVSGFSHPIRTEPLWITAQNQGKKVLALAYVGADGATPERKATWGVAYPNGGLVSRSQLITMDLSSLQNAGKGAPLPVEKVSLTLNPKTEESREIFVLPLTPDGFELVIDTDNNPDNGFLARLNDLENAADLFFVETNAASETLGFKRRVFVRKLAAPQNTIRLYFSGASYNNAYPESYRQQLDDADLVWPQYGLEGDSSREEYFEAKTTLERYLVQVAELSNALLDFDILLFYHPIIDSTGHAHESELPLPLSPSHDDAVTKNYIDAYTLVDENLARLFALATPTDVIALMGDHGMDPSVAAVNYAALLPTEADRMALAGQVVTSGSMMLIYSDLSNPRYLGFLNELQLIEYNGQPIVDQVLLRAEAKDEWHYGEATAAVFSAPGFWGTFRSEEDEIFQVPPPAKGMHGHLTSHPEMQTGFYLRAPGIEPVDLGSISLIDAVPTFVARLGLTPAATCRGRDLFGNAMMY